MTPYYDKDGITIYLGDCLDVMPQLEPGFDMILADLPYGTTACEFDKPINRIVTKVIIKSIEALKINPLLIDILKSLVMGLYRLPINPVDLWPHYKRLIKDNGAVVLTARQPFTSILVVSNINGFKYEWAWKKSHATNQINMNNQPMTEHENILVFGEGRITYNMQLTKKPLDKIRAPTRMGLSECYGAQREYDRTIPVDMRAPTSVLEINSVNHGERGLHPTQKPVALMSYLIRTYTNPGELILDNTMGSGTTLVSAQNEGRRAVGIEISEDYCKIAIDRLRQKSLFSIIKPEPKPEHKQLSLEVV